MAHLLLILLSISSTIGVDDRTIMNTRFNYCDKDLQFMAPPELFKDIILPYFHQQRQHQPVCYFFVRGAEDRTAKKAPNREGYSFDLNVAREICKRYGTTVQTIRNDEEFDEYAYHRMMGEKTFALGAKLRFVRNEDDEFKETRSVWEVEKWDDDMPSVLNNVRFRGSPHTGDGNDAEALLLYDATGYPPSEAASGFFVLQSHESVENKIRFFCKQNMTTLKYHYPVWPTPAPSDEDQLKPGTKQVDVCEEKPDGLKTQRESIDRCCYFQIPESTDKVNFQFQPGYYRFLFQRARAMCQEYVSSTLLTIQEIHDFDYINFLLEADEFYAVGVTLKQTEKNPNSLSDPPVPHYTSWKIKKWDESDSFDGWPHILAGEEFRAIYHPDDDDAAGLIFYKPDSVGSKPKDWYVLQNSVGIRKKVQFLCKQEIAAGKKIVANNTSQPTDRWGSSSSNGVSKKTTGKEQMDSSSSRHTPEDLQGQSTSPPPKLTSSQPGEHRGPSPARPPKNLDTKLTSGCKGGNRKFIVQGVIALIISSIIADCG